MKILFQILSTGSMRSELQYISMLCAKRGAATGIVYGHRGYMAKSRNAALNTFLKGDCDVLIQCDEDVIPPLNILDITRWRKPIVGTIALYANERGPTPNFKPISPLTQADLMPIPAGDVPLVEVAWIGTGCYSITRAAAEHMVKTYVKAFAHDDQPDGSEGMGVDVFMCYRAREAGLSVWLDRSLLCGHSKEMTWAPTKDGQLAILPYGSMWVGDNVPKDGNARKSYSELLAEMGMNPDALSSEVYDA